MRVPSHLSKLAWGTHAEVLLHHIHHPTPCETGNPLHSDQVSATKASVHLRYPYIRLFLLGGWGTIATAAAFMVLISKCLRGDLKSRSFPHPSESLFAHSMISVEVEHWVLHLLEIWKDLAQSLARIVQFAPSICTLRHRLGDVKYFITKSL